MKRERGELWSERGESRFSARLVAVALAVGVILRIHQYLANRSLWLDELFLGLNIVPRSFSELLQPLSDNQAAPVGFLLIEKASVSLLGPTEYALRLFPLLAGLTALWLMYRVARLLLAPDEALVAVVLFATLDAPIYFSSELKQYSSDTAVSLGLLWMGMTMLRHPGSRRISLIAALVGAAAIWFSHPAVFVLAGIGLTCLIAALQKRESRNDLAALVAVGTVWIGSFLLWYTFTLQTIRNPGLQSFWSTRFLPLPSSLVDVEWVGTNIAFLVRNGFGMAIPAALVLTFGAICLYRRAGWRAPALLLLPGAFTLAAGLLGLYPFNGRLILFLLPLALCVMAAGVAEIASTARRRAGAFGAAIVLLVVFAQPIGFAAFHLAVPRTREEARPAIASYLARRQTDDSLYVYPGARAAYGYYARGVEETGPVLLGGSRRSAREEYRKQVDQFRGSPRVWVLFSHVYREVYDEDEREYLVSYLDSIGRRVTLEGYPGAWLYLYDLSTHADHSSK